LDEDGNRVVDAPPLEECLKRRRPYIDRLKNEFDALRNWVEKKKQDETLVNGSTEQCTSVSSRSKTSEIGLD